MSLLYHLRAKKYTLPFSLLLSFPFFSGQAQTVEMKDMSGLHLLAVLPLKQAGIETNYVRSPAKAEDRPNKEKLVGLCSSIFQRKEDRDPNSPYVYEYQRKIIEASCADMEKDSEAEISRKVNIMWNKFENDLGCTDGSFDVINGNILKLAVSRRLVSVIEDAAQVWLVNLNRIDPSDQMTVLDYVEKERKIYEKTENENTLKRYYEVLRKAGAKHRSEL